VIASLKSQPIQYLLSEAAFDGYARLVVMSSVPESVHETSLVLCYSQVVNTEANPYVLVEEDREGFVINTLADGENSQMVQSSQRLSRVARSIDTSVQDK
jgi:hypothetical protein